VPQLGLFAGDDAPASDTAASLPRMVNGKRAPAAPTVDLEAAEAAPEPAAPPVKPAPVIVSPVNDGWLARLNADQTAAATTVDRCLAIVAGPGTGKTRTLTVRIAHLLAAHGVPPAAVLAITFTNKAADEMRSRLVDLVGEATAERLTIATFHALGAQLLRRYGDRLGLPADFAIVDAEDQAAILRRALPELGERDATRTLEWISRAKGRGLTAEDPALGEVPDAKEFGPRYAAYAAALSSLQAVDFDDLILLPLRLLAAHPAVAAEVHARYGWISVDEYQDVNLAQYQLLRQLAAGGANVCVIGDPDQAIYGFRGADPAYFRAFAEDFPGAATVCLRACYRSPQGLLDAAVDVINHNDDDPAQHEARRLVSAFTQAITLDVYPATTDRAEAEFVVHSVEQAVGGTSYFSLDSGRVTGVEEKTRTFGDFAVLYRLGVQRAALVEAFERSGIPYQVAGDSFLDRREIRHILALLRLRGGHGAPQLALTTLLGAGKGALDDAGITWWADVIAARGVEAALRSAANGGTLTPTQRKRIGGLLALWVDWPKSARLADQIEPLFAAWLAWQGEKPSAAQQERIAHLRLAAAPFGDQAGAFLDRIALQSAVDALDPRADRVSILSLHAAKGLEFPVVYMVGCEEGLLPYVPPAGTEANPATRTVDLAEERRLFYVGMTRAQAALTLCHAGRRLLFGQTVTLPLSRFVEEITAARKAVLTPTPLPQKRVRADDLQMKLL
jgi:superfamily I DNA/RNA helicase